MSVKYSLLNTKHPEYCECKLLKNHCLYWAGEELRNNIRMFLPQQQFENALNYKNRLENASYKNFFASIINSYVSELFSKTISCIPAADADDPTTPGENIDNEEDFYYQFSKNADLKGNSFTTVLEEILTEALVHNKAYVFIDFPKPEIEPKNLLEEEKLGISRAYIYTLPTEVVIDWEKDDEGEFTFVVIKTEYCKRKSLLDQRKTKFIRFKVWTKTEDVVKWQIYEIEVKVDKEPKKDEEVPLIDEGIASFDDIPIIELEIDSKLAIGDLISDNCVEYFQRYSALVFAEARNLFSIPVYHQSAEYDGASINSTTEDVNRGEKSARQMRSKGFAVVAEKDKIEFAEPEGKAYEIVDNQLKELKDEIYKITHIMANSLTGTTKASNQSGLSKLMDNRSKTIVLEAFGELMKDFSTKIYNMISEFRKEDIMWSCLGMDSFNLTLDRDQLLKEAIAFGQMDVPKYSKTAKKLFLTQICTQFLDYLTPNEQLIIKQEISEAVDKVPDEPLTASQTAEQTQSNFDKTIDSSTSKNKDK